MLIQKAFNYINFMEKTSPLPISKENKIKEYNQNGELKKICCKLYGVAKLKL